MRKLFLLTVIFSFRLIHAYSQAHPCLDSADFYSRNQIKTITITTFQGEVIVNQVKYTFNKESSSLIICPKDIIRDSSNCERRNFKKTGSLVFKRKAVTRFKFDERNRLTQKTTTGISPSAGKYTETRSYFYADSLSSRLKMKTYEGLGRIMTSYFYYDSGLLVKNVTLDLKADASTETTVTTYKYEYDNKGRVTLEMVFKGNDLLCSRRYEYELYPL